MRSLEDLSIEELCTLLEIEHQDIIDRFTDKIYEKGLDTQVDKWYTDDDTLDDDDLSLIDEIEEDDLWLNPNVEDDSNDD